MTQTDDTDEAGGLSFPRPDDGLPRAYGLSGSRPVEIWERFSPAYEAQAEAVLDAIADMGLTAVLDWAGSEDGEAAIGLDDDDQIVLLFHLEDPVEARLLAQARGQGRLADLLRQAANE